MRLGPGIPRCVSQASHFPSQGLGRQARLKVLQGPFQFRRSVVLNAEEPADIMAEGCTGDE